MTRQGNNVSYTNMIVYKSYMWYSHNNVTIQDWTISLAHTWWIKLLLFLTLCSENIKQVYLKLWWLWKNSIYTKSNWYQSCSSKKESSNIPEATIFGVILFVHESKYSYVLHINLKVTNFKKIKSLYSISKNCLN